jgi:hypothetical protein
MVVLVNNYVEPDIVEFLKSLGISNECTLIDTNVLSNLSLFLDRIIKIHSDINKGKKIGVIIPKSKRDDLTKLINSIGGKHRITIYIFISERLADNIILICDEK